MNLSGSLTMVRSRFPVWLLFIDQLAIQVDDQRDTGQCGTRGPFHPLVEWKQETKTDLRMGPN